MAWLRSLAAIVLGGFLAFFLSCAGEMVLPDIGPRPTIGPPLGVAAVGTNLPIPPGAVSAALEPAPYGTRYLALLFAGIVAGFAAARMAGRAGRWHGALTAWPPALFLIAFLLFDTRTRIELAPFIDIAVGAVAGGIGGWLSERRRAMSNGALTSPLSGTTPFRR